MSNERIWFYLKIAVGILAILTLSPLVTPAGVHTPELGGMPYTLWVGIIDAFLIVGITWLATRIHPGRHE